MIRTHVGGLSQRKQRPIHLSQDPEDRRKCEEWKRVVEIVRRGITKIKIAPPPPQPPEPWDRIGNIRIFDGGPDPRFRIDDNIRDVLLNELVVDAIRRAPVGVGANPSIFTQLKESGVYKQIVEELHQEFTAAATSLKQELDSVDEECKGQQGQKSS